MSAKVINGFPDYTIDEEGKVYNTRRRHYLRPTRAANGGLKVKLYVDGMESVRYLTKLVAEHHLYNPFDPEIFDTAIHLDNDNRNVHVDNLAWRPRWFAVKYQQQYWQENYRNGHPTIQDNLTGEVYHSFVEVCQKFGILWFDVVRSDSTGDWVMPIKRSFTFL